MRNRLCVIENKSIARHFHQARGRKCSKPQLDLRILRIHGDHAIDTILQRAVDLRQVPGVVAMAATDRAVIYEGAFGPRSVGAATKMSPDTIFRIASMTKPMVTVAPLWLLGVSNCGWLASLTNPARLLLRSYALIGPIGPLRG